MTEYGRANYFIDIFGVRQFSSRKDAGARPRRSGDGRGFGPDIADGRSKAAPDGAVRGLIPTAQDADASGR